MQASSKKDAKLLLTQQGKEDTLVGEGHGGRRQMGLAQ